MPVPIVNNGQLQYTFEGPKVYYNILNQLIGMEKSIDADDADFLKLIVDNIQIFERHWRKMVADIRTAKLDRNLQVPQETRVAFEASNLPRPLLASKLDFTFRQLGFHNKVLGKDINIQPFAEKKEWSLKETRINTELKRKTSHPTLDITPIEEFMHTISTRSLSSAQQNTSTDGAESRPSSKRLSLTTAHSKSRPQTMSKRQMILKSINGDNGTDSSKGDLKSITIGSSGAFTPFSAESKRRRGSETDVQTRPSTVTSQEVDVVNYAQLTASRLEYNQVLEMPIGDLGTTVDNRYVCPFPACGKSFHSREAAFRHMPSHELKSRLAAPTPLADSHLSNYWVCCRIFSLLFAPTFCSNYLFVVAYNLARRRDMANCGEVHGSCSSSGIMALSGSGLQCCIRCQVEARTSHPCGTHACQQFLCFSRLL